MRKYMLALLAVSGVAAAQGFRVPILHHDPVDTEREALHEKLTRLAETRKSLGMPEAQPGSTQELDALTASARAKRAVKPAALKKTTHTRAAASAWPPPPQTWSSGNQEPSLGEVARKYREQKRQAHSKE